MIIIILIVILCLVTIDNNNKIIILTIIGMTTIKITMIITTQRGEKTIFKSYFKLIVNVSLGIR